MTVFQLSNSFSLDLSVFNDDLRTIDTFKTVFSNLLLVKV